MSARDILRDRSFIEGEKQFDEATGSTEVVFVTEGMLARMLEEAGKAGAQVYREEHRKDTKKAEDAKLARTRRMLSGYRSVKFGVLRDEVESAPTEAEKIEMKYGYLQFLMGIIPDPVTKDVDRLRQDIFNIEQIEKAARLYKSECEKSKNQEDIRRYDVMEMTYLTEEKYTMQDIAEITNVSEKTLYRDLRKACESMSYYLLGI